jgi:hypothetical protein
MNVNSEFAINMESDDLPQDVQILNVSSDFTCLICFCIKGNIKQTSCCKKNICIDCEESIKKNSVCYQCPFCRVEIKSPKTPQNALNDSSHDVLSSRSSQIVCPLCIGEEDIKQTLCCRQIICLNCEEQIIKNAYETRSYEVTCPYCRHKTPRPYRLYPDIHNDELLSGPYAGFNHIYTPQIVYNQTIINNNLPPQRVEQNDSDSDTDSEQSKMNHTLKLLFCTELLFWSIIMSSILMSSCMSTQNVCKIYNDIYEYTIIQLCGIYLIFTCYIITIFAEIYECVNIRKFIIALLTLLYFVAFAVKITIGIMFLTSGTHKNDVIAIVLFVADIFHLTYKLVLNIIFYLKSYNY